MYCGDGINDLVALAAADVGMAIGSSSASAAASISDQNASVQGVSHHTPIADPNASAQGVVHLTPTFTIFDMNA